MGTLRKILTTGVGAALMTESGLRSALSDIKLRDYLARQASKGKEELTKVLVSEIKRFLEHIDLHEEIQKALSGMTLEVNASVRLAPSDSKKETRLTVRRLKISNTRISK